ncbi:MAG: lysylphosphatidylglycerol synthase transmembrane domain-containing protein [Haloarculaceae archaeon]
MGRTRLKSAIGFAIAVGILGLILWVVGYEEVIAALAGADTGTAALTVPVAALWLSAWGLSLYVVLGALGAPIAPHRAIFVFTAAVFVNNATPFGQAGGEPVSAMFISSAAESRYETGLAAIASVDTLHFVPSLSLAAIGLGFVGLSAVQLSGNLLVAVGAVVVLAAIVPIAGYLGWRHRLGIKGFILAKLTPPIEAIGGFLPVVDSPSKELVEERIEGFFDSVSKVATDRRTIIAAMSLSTVGWICLSTSLWLSLYALGYVIPYPAILFVVPLGSIAGTAPLPGGLGGLEAAFAALLVPLGIPASVALSAVLIHRAATFWLPTIVGGGAATILGMRANRNRG